MSGNLLQVSFNVGDDDEVDDEEGGVEHEVGAADQHRAGPHTQLQTRDHGHPGNYFIVKSQNYFIFTLNMFSQLDESSF